MFEDIPTKRPHFFFLIPGKKYFALKKVRVQIRCHCLSPCRQIQIVDKTIGKIARVVHNDIRLADISNLSGERTPLFFLCHIEFEGRRRRTDLTDGVVRRLEVGRNDPCAAFCECQRDRLADPLSGAGDQDNASLVRF